MNLYYMKRGAAFQLSDVNPSALERAPQLLDIVCKFIHENGEHDMKRFLPVILTALILGGCATFKELKPEPPLSPAERGYIELKDDKNNFELDKDGKYFIRFPKPESEQYALVLKMTGKRSLNYYLTGKFDDGQGDIEKIKDEMAANDSVSAYYVGTAFAEYYWVIDGVASDMQLTMTYRYVPQWRFTFENKYAEFSKTLADNKLDRTTYKSIDRSFDFSTFPFGERISQLNTTSKNIRSLKDDLAKLESVFPSNIASSRDTAYEKYVALRNQTNDEFKFQDDYTAILSIFLKEQETHGSIAKFLEVAPEFSSFVSQRNRFPRPILDKAADVFSARLAGAANFYDQKLQAKNDGRPITFTPPLGNARKLYEAVGTQPSAEFSGLTSFVDRFNLEANAVQSVNERFRQIDNSLGPNAEWSSEALWADLLAKTADAKTKIPESKAATFDKFGRYNCTTGLATEIQNASARANASEILFRSGQQYIQQLNANSWGPAEETLRSLSTDGSFAAVPSVNEQKGRFVRQFETELFNRVKTLSQQRVDAFVKANEAAIDNVPKLYQDSAFTPVHSISFSTGGDAELQRRRAEIQTYIDRLKFNDFPAASIKAIYREFTQNINNRGVERARAIVEHGKFYKGDDKTLRSQVNECDPMIAKWITKPKEYRKQYVLPISTNRSGVNEYVFRVSLRIPSEAQFPVFEINIKLPKEVAEKAGQQSWYESIKLNKTPIKNEGRFTITAPSAENNYESQVSPVQMDKAGNNIFEVRFKHPSFKVFEVSTMAQVPIIRKN